MNREAKAENPVRGMTPRVIGFVLAMLGFAVFVPSIFHGFSEFDDGRFVYLNPSLEKGLSWNGVLWAVQAGAQTPDPHVEYWMPLTLLSRLADYQISGLAPWWSHLVNVLLHSGATALLFAALYKFTACKWRSAFVALLFACHPLQVETVAWIAGRRDGMGGFFWMVTLLAYAHYAKRRTRKAYLLLLLAYLGAIASKPTVLTLPAALLLLDFWPLNRFASEPVARLVVEKLPLFLMSLFCLFTSVLAQADIEAFYSTIEFPVWLRLANAAASYLYYVRDFVLPFHLAPAYPHPGLKFDLMQTWLALAVLAPVTIGALMLRNRAPWFFTGWFWFGGVLVPMLQLAQMGDVARADRYMYLPMIGLGMVVSWGAESLMQKYRLTRSKAAMAAAVAAMFLIARTSHQLWLWGDSTRLWSHALRVTERNSIALLCLAAAEVRNGKHEKAKELYRSAIELDFRIVGAWRGLAGIAMREGKPKEAAYYFTRAVKLDPRNRALKLSLAAAWEASGEKEKASEVLQELGGSDPLQGVSGGQE
jgi:tetratricopeptide (TPR) repeat protein